MKVYYNSKLAKRLLFGNFKTCMFFGTVITKLAQLSARTKRRGHPHPPVLGVLRIRSRPLVPRAWSRAPVLRAPFGRMAPAGAFHLLPALRRRVGNILRISHDTRRCPRPMERRSLPRFGIRNGSLRPRERARIPT